MLHTIPEICQITSKTRAEIYTLLNNGIMSYLIDSDGKRKLETSELTRVFPNIDASVLLSAPFDLAVNSPQSPPSTLTKEMQELRDMVTDLKEQINLVLEDNSRLLRLLDFQASHTKNPELPPNAPLPATDMAKQGWQQYQQMREQNNSNPPANPEDTIDKPASKSWITTVKKFFFYS